MREALEEELGYGTVNSTYRRHVRELMSKQGNGQPRAEEVAAARRERLFPNLDGVRFLPHQADAAERARTRRRCADCWPAISIIPTLPEPPCLSLGCQHAQASILMEELRARDPKLRKQVIIVDQQSAGTESNLMNIALDKTFAALAEANRTERAPAPLSALTVALQCGGSDGFSGISANPTVGYVSDLVVGAGGTTSFRNFRTARRGAGTGEPMHHR